MDIKTIIRNSMAKAFFASSWADLQRENGITLRGEIMVQIPNKIDHAAIHAADTLIFSIERLNKQSIEQCFFDLCESSKGKGDREHSPENFGHYAAMQAMGHGIGLYDAFGSRLIIIPFIEFGYCSLSMEY